MFCLENLFPIVVSMVMFPYGRQCAVVVLVASDSDLG